MQSSVELSYFCPELACIGAHGSCSRPILTRLVVVDVIRFLALGRNENKSKAPANAKQPLSCVCYSSSILSCNGAVCIHFIIRRSMMLLSPAAPHWKPWLVQVVPAGGATSALSDSMDSCFFVISCHHTRVRRIQCV